ncbi:MAG: hypothetical protein ACI8ZM_005294 [Crocinitomix sp.]|jgi:hypothetical protein
MKKIIVLAALLCALKAVQGQTFTNEKFTLKYFQPNIIEVPTPATYTLEGIVESIEETKVYYPTSEGFKKGKLYFSKGSNLFDGALLMCGNPDTIPQTGAHVKAITRVPKIISARPMSYTFKDKNGVSSKCYGYNVTLESIHSYTILNAENKEVFNENIVRQNEFSFPGGLKNKIRYSKKEAAASAYSTLKADIIKKQTNLDIRSGLTFMRNHIKYNVRSSKEKVEIDLAILDIKKKEIPTYADIFTLNSKLIETIDALNVAFKGGSEMNWHTIEFQKNFQELSAGYKGILDEEMAKTAAGSEGRLSNQYFIGLYKNYLWSRLFMGEYELVLEEATNLQAADKQNFKASTFAALSSELKLSFGKIKKFAEDYRIVYKYAKDRSNWK